MTNSLVEAMKQNTRKNDKLFRSLSNGRVVSRSWALDKDGAMHNGRWVCHNEKNGKFFGISDDPNTLTYEYVGGAVESTTDIYYNHHLVMTREYGMAEWNMPFAGMWTVRDIRTGELIDNSRYVNDMIDKYNFAEK